METKKAAGEAASQQDASRDDKTGQLIRFPKPKHPRGRPRKGAKTPSRDDFDIVCAAIKGIPKGRRLAAAKAEARRMVGADTRSSATAIALFDRIMDAINHIEGRDWHSVGHYAKDGQCDKPKRSIERAMRELVDNGHLIRRRRKAANGGWDISETTSPTLARAGSTTVVEQEPETDPPEQDDHTDEKDGMGTDQEIGRGIDKECAGYRPINAEGTDQNGGLISKYNLQENLLARERAQDDCSMLDGQKEAAASPPVIPKPSIAPRFDLTLSLRQRIDLFRFGEPATEEDRKLKRSLLRAAKGWDRQALKNSYCAWMEQGKRPAPQDAMLAFIGWIDATASRRQGDGS